MKTRIFQTRLYKDREILRLSLEAQHLFIYLITCEHINICGIFELPDPYIILESKLSLEQLSSAKKELQKLKKIIFKDSWVFVVNARKNNNYEKSRDNYKAMLKELNRIPEYIAKVFDEYSPYSSIESTLNSSVDSSPDSNNKQEIINKKQELINNKSETINKKQEIVKGWKDKLKRDTDDNYINKYNK